MLGSRSPEPRTLLLTTDAVGGVWRYSLDLARGLGRLGVDTVLMVAGPPPSADQLAEASRIASADVRIAGGQLDWMAESEAEFSRSVDRLIDAATRVHTDTIQVHAPAYAGRHGWPAPVVAVAHSCTATWWSAVKGSVLPPYLRWRGAATQRGMACADAVIAPTAGFAASLCAVHGTERAIAVVHNGSDSATAVGTRRGRTVISAGRLWDEAKNAATLDIAAALLSDPVRAAGPTTGPGGETIALPHLQLLGTLSRDEIVRELASAAVFASVARYEPFGLAVLEAARAGCALVLSDIGTFRELWSEAALFVDADDAEALVSVLKSLLGSPQRCRAIAALARERAAHFSVEAMARSTWAVHRACARASVAGVNA